MKYAPYSFSKIKTFQQCPKQFEWKYVNKKDLDDDYTDPTFFQRGRFIHQYIAKRLAGGSGDINGYIDIDVDDKLSLIESADKMFENDYINMTFDFDITEIEKPIKLDYNLITTDTKEYAINGYIDYFAVQGNLAVIVDWKSGKYRENPRYDQLELYAIWVLQNYEDVDEIDLVFYYIEHDKFVMKTVTLDQVIKFRNNLGNNISEIENSEVFNINPTRECTFCPFFNSCSDEFGITI